MESAASIAANLQRVTAAIRAAETNHGRERGSVSLLAVSKTKPVETIIAAADAGQIAFGENYVQEAQKKIETLSEHNLEWHFIGPIQSNKTRHIAALFAWVHSVDRVSIAERLSRQRPAGLPDLNVCIQINISGEETKAGAAPAQIKEILDLSAGLPGLKLRGLMAIPAPTSDIVVQRRIFAEARRIFDSCADAYALDTLSMGMSGDFESAIAEGATIVRLGTAIFGAREP